jgi:hypothetical protein
MTKRRALLIGITTFDDSKAFPNLRTPSNDVLDFANVLEKFGETKKTSACRRGVKRCVGSP